MVQKPWLPGEGQEVQGRRERWRRLAAEKARDKDGFGPARSLFHDSQGTVASSCHVTQGTQQEGPGSASPCPAGRCPPIPPLDAHKGCPQGWSHGLESLITAERAVGCEDLHAGTMLSGARGTTSQAPKGRAGSQGRMVCAQEAVGGEEAMGGLGRWGRGVCPWPYLLALPGVTMLPREKPHSPWSSGRGRSTDTLGASSRPLSGPS